MTHLMFWRRETRQSCETCREAPAGPPCYDCTFGLQTPPPHYTSVQILRQPLQQHSSLPSEGHIEYDVASLAQGVTRIGIAVAMAVGESHPDALRVPESDALSSRIRHWSDQIPRNSDHSSVTRNASAPDLHSLGIQMDEPLPTEEETHVLLSALTTTSLHPEPSLDSPRASPLPCQLLIPE
ncbi:uncharacterized protein LOC123498703 [Portunus trituberculatus]|uniref:uncharacterized protein LOC123498703 n=1 Tax=Portunus trituberculatus TaxID=210409 RepID=UPI001E1D0570|nr:uncharacterized protein LOC123498703 [Portunus trituberculatus]